VIDILIPVLNRPHRAEPLVKNIRMSTVGEHKITFICSPGDKDQLNAVRPLGTNWMVVDWQAGPGDYAKKINYGYAMNEVSSKVCEFLFLGADDLCFCQGWDLHAVATAEATGASVIGTDDLGNATVQRGDHSTHSLVRRSYISEQGGSWDGPGIVYHEGYDHQYVDSELVAVAKQRGEWAFARSSKVEHMHYFWNKSHKDATYEKALAKSSEDNKLWAHRRRLYRG
jgi:hypothetical protein